MSMLLYSSCSIQRRIALFTSIRRICYILAILLIVHGPVTIVDAAGNAAARHRIRHTRHGHARHHQDDETHGRQWSLSCPHVADSSNEKVRLDVVWTLDDTIWLKIEDGEKRIYNQLTSFNKRKIAGKTVMRVVLNQGRYFFDYDELTGDFNMEIRPIVPEHDAGVWQCHVTVHNRGNTHSLTSRSRVKNKTTANQSSEKATTDHRLQSDRPSLLPRPAAYSKTTLIERPPPPVSPVGKDRGSGSSAFTRPDQETVEINRDHVERNQAVVFDRPGALLPGSTVDNLGTHHRTPHHHQTTPQLKAEAFARRESRISRQPNLAYRINGAYCTCLFMAFLSVFALYSVA